jgi:hypothetical protein
MTTSVHYGKRCPYKHGGKYKIRTENIGESADNFKLACIETL